MRDLPLDANSSVCTLKIPRKIHGFLYSMESWIQDVFATPKFSNPDRFSSSPYILYYLSTEPRIITMPQPCDSTFFSPRTLRQRSSLSTRRVHNLKLIQADTFALQLCYHAIKHHHPVASIFFTTLLTHIHKYSSHYITQKPSYNTTYWQGIILATRGVHPPPPRNDIPSCINQFSTWFLVEH
jgi:hypothetical protein